MGSAGGFAPLVPVQHGQGEQKAGDSHGQNGPEQTQQLHRRQAVGGSLQSQPGIVGQGELTQYRQGHGEKLTGPEGAPQYQGEKEQQIAPPLDRGGIAQPCGQPQQDPEGGSQ